MKIGGVALGLIGVAMIFSNELHLAGTAALWGSAAVVFGAVATSYASVLVKARGGDLDPAVLSAGQMIFGWVPLLLVGLWQEGAPWRFHWTGQAVFALFYLALMGSSLAFCLMYWLVRRTEITRIMLISLVTPVAAVVIGAAVLGEKIGPALGARWHLRAARVGLGDLPEGVATGHAAHRTRRRSAGKPGRLTR